MNLKSSDRKHSREGNILLALHSCSSTFGVAILDIRSPKQSFRSSSFQIGRSLSNDILSCIEEILPASHWAQLARLSVAIGPGGFTGTRLSVVVARTLAQQLDCHLDGVTSFALMAPRLVKVLDPLLRDDAFWVVKDLPRRGIVAGKYQIKTNADKKCIEEVLELEKPHLLAPNFQAKPSINASDDVKKDVAQLLNISFHKHKKCKENPWNDVLPIYPTSPVDNYKK